MKDSAIVIDRDAPAWTPEMFARAVVRKGLKPIPGKSLLSLRIDADVLDWFRGQGRGYQSRMNALLRSFMQAHKQIHADRAKTARSTATRKMQGGQILQYRTIMKD